MSPSIQQETTVAIEAAEQMLDSFTRARSAAFALLRITVDKAITALEAQPARYNIATAADFRTLQFDNGGSISGVIRGWKLKWGLYIIPGLDGVVTSPDAQGMGQYIPFESFLPKSATHGISYVDLVAAIAELTEAAAQARGSDGMDND